MFLKKPYQYLLTVIFVSISQVHAQSGDVPTLAAQETNRLHSDEASIMQSQQTLLPGEAVISDADMAENLSEALTFTKYPTYEQYDSMMHYFADTFPELCSIDTIGTSLEGRLLLTLKLSDNPSMNEAEPRFMYSATMHGDELIGYILTLRLIDFLLTNYDSNIEVERLLNAAEIWINPLSNPDGTFRTGNHTVVGSTRENAAGKDLNRNYPDIRIGEVDDTASLPHENKQMMMFLREHKFNLSANIHSGEEVVNYPWDYKVGRHPDDAWWQFVSREYADLAHDVQPNYIDGFEDGITNGWDWYYVYGGRQDYVNFFLNGRELTLELSTSKLLSSSSLNTYWNYNQWSLFNYMQQSTYGIHGIVTDEKSGNPLAAKIVILDYDENLARIYVENSGYRWLSTDTLSTEEYEGATQVGSWVLSDSTFGAFYRYLKEGNYDLQVSCEGYVTDTIHNVQVTDFSKTDLNVRLQSVIPTVSEREADVLFRIYPNPIQDYAIIEASELLDENTQLFIYDIHGRLVSSMPWEAGQKESQLDIQNLESGIYLIKIHSKSSHSLKRIIIL